MVSEFTLMQWSQFIFAVILFLGPGCFLQWFLPTGKQYYLTHRIVFAISLSISFWIVLLNWLKFLNIRVTPVVVFTICILAWVIAGILFIKLKQKISFPNTLRLEHFVLWVIVFIIVVYNLYSFRNVVVGLGSDSFHHTLIADLIRSQGIIPNDYQPATDKLVSFTYHFGFHANIAVLGWLTSLPTRLLVIMSGPLLIGLSMLTVSLVTETIFKEKGSGIIAALVVGIICVFPTYILNWGRYTQFTGMAVEPVFLSLLLDNYKQRPYWKPIALSGLLAASITLIHYRVIMFIAVGIVIYFAIYALFFRKQTAMLVQSALLFVGSGLAAFLFSFPWFIHLLDAKRSGYPFFLFSNIDSSYYSINRLGYIVLGYPTNTILFGLAALALVIAIFQKNWKIIWLYVWALVLYLISSNHFTNGYMDLISVVISFCIPLSIAVDWGLFRILDRSPKFAKYIFLLIAGSSIIFFVNTNPPIILSESAYVKESDLEVAQWVKENTSDAAYFMVNTFNFHFSEDFIIGSDAGYWFPLIAERKTVTLPMVYMTEQFRDPGRISYLRKINELQGNLTTIDSLQLLSSEGITHVFVGENGGNIDVQKLLSSENFIVEYNKERNYIFRVVYENKE